MNIVIETERLLIRELKETDDQDLFEMDSDPEVHLFIDNQPVKTIDEIQFAIKSITTQYKKNGIGRWAVIDKLTNECIGWSGLKYYNEKVNNQINFYELGYRFKRKHWGKGYATEACSAILNYGFKHLNIESAFAITHPNNLNSKKVLIKLGFKFVESFSLDGEPTHWFELKKSTWNGLASKAKTM